MTTAQVEVHCTVTPAADRLETIDSKRFGARVLRHRLLEVHIEQELERWLYALAPGQGEGEEWKVKIRQIHEPENREGCNTFTDSIGRPYRWLVSVGAFTAGGHSRGQALANMVGLIVGGACFFPGT